MKNHVQVYQQFVRPELARVLQALKLDNIYHSAFNDNLFTTFHGKETAVADFLGGFGSTILGHNHPEILSTIDECRTGQRPQHTQGSLKAQTAILAEMLNNLVKEKLGDERDFITTLANTGTEAVEVALKHALLEWKERREHLVLKIRTHLARARKVTPEMVEAAENFIAKISALSPVMLSLDKSFHGKTSGAVSLSGNTSYKKMFESAPVSVKFFTVHGIEEFKELIENSDSELLITPTQKITFSSVIGFIYEPIQGEGGITEIPKHFLYQVFTLLKQRNIPLIADEIQSGLFRTGKFLCSEWFNLKPDYILLGKSLGGGVSKISACLVAKDHYVEEFGWLQTSTFSEDDWSSMVAVKALEILLRDQDQIALAAQAFEENIYQHIEDLKNTYPGIIRRVKGRGFFLGLEFNFEDEAPLTDLMLGIYEHGHATYVYTSYLLHHHHVRVGVTLSAPEVIRLEPSAFVTPDSVNNLKNALSSLCKTISERKNLQLTSHLWDQTFSNDQLATVSENKSQMVSSNSAKDHHIGFLTHVVNPIQAQSLDKAFHHVEPKELEKFFKNYTNQAVPFRYYQQKIEGLNGKNVILNLYGVMQPSSYFEDSLRQQNFKAARLVQDAVDLARSHEMRYFGLGQFTSIVSENGLLLNPKELPVTTGNSLTAGMAVLAIQKIARDKNIDLKKARIGVVGFAGNICNVLTQVIADEADHFILINREPVSQNAKYQEALDILMSETSLKKENIKIGHDLMELQQCDIVIIGTNAATEIIRSEHIKPNSIVLDISVPSNVQSEVKKRSDVSYIQGGLARLSIEQVVTHPWVPLKTGDCFACMAETIALGLHRMPSSYSLGKINKSQVLESIELASQVGITLGGFRKY